MQSPTPVSSSARTGQSRASSAPHALTPAEIEAYHRDGFVIPRFKLSADEVGRLRALLAKLVADNPRFADFLMQCPHVPGNGVQGLKTGPGWMEFAAHPAILDMVEQLMGPDIILRGTSAFYKRPEKGPATAWHRDAAGLPITPLAGVHVWIAASDARIENACLRYIPGSHKKQEIGDHYFGDFEELRADGSVGPAMAKGQYDDSKAVDLEMSAGQMVLFDVFAAHASRPNSGRLERMSYALRFMPATSLYHHDKISSEISSNGYGHHTRPLMLLRGVDRAGNDFRRGHPDHESK